MAMHMPVNHPLRPLYRTLAFLSGVAVLAFGAIGFLQTQVSRSSGPVKRPRSG